MPSFSLESLQATWRKTMDTIKHLLSKVEIGNTVCKRIVIMSIIEKYSVSLLPGIEE